MKIGFYTLGCKVNQNETQAMQSIMEERGHTIVSSEEPADAYIINTCTVTAVSDKKSRQMIRRLKRNNPDSVIAVCGCYAQTKPAELSALEVDLVAGTSDRIGFLDTIERLSKEHTQSIHVDNIMHCHEFEELPAGGMLGRTRASLKVEDGCLNFCTYCIIPFARGPVRSLPLESAVEQTKKLVKDGYHEIVITGIEISSWGQDLPGKPSLINLLEAVSEAAPNMRLRLGSLEPRTITEEFCARASKLPNLCEHFHLSLQSGCDATLQRMHRKYDTARYLLSCELLRRYFADPAITTDLITGFPGESEEEFAQTLAFIQKARFAAMHVFPYSRRTGTKAAEMDGQISNDLKEERCRIAIEIASQMEKEYLSRRIGKRVQVLFEEEKNGYWRGHTTNYMEVYAKGENLHNTTVPVQLISVADGHLIGILEESNGGKE